ncbi:MAG: hypothetical protein ACFFEK_13465 [Candidatus Thorarchaeota archaeon]
MKLSEREYEFTVPGLIFMVSLGPTILMTQKAAQDSARRDLDDSLCVYSKERWRASVRTLI